MLKKHVGKGSLKELGIEGVTKPVEKNDLLNKQLKKQEIAEQEEKIERQRPQGIDYTSELAAYNAKLREVQAEEARLRAQAEAANRERQQQLLQERQMQAEEERRIAAEQAAAKAQAAREKAEQERAAKAKAAQEKAAKLKAQVEALKTERKTLQTKP